MFFTKQPAITTTEEAKQRIDEMADMLLEAKKRSRVRITKRFMKQVTKDRIITNQEAYEMLKQSFEERK
ncbi:hypothetical protein [Priestia aryabhattai]|uniref:hypothetical protein n=1 Tax=Priestia aryabhattai TaxID=412384 RepID=UPI0015F5A4D8|nr:hypothetical protein [Priestia aryabhattai]